MAQYVAQLDAAVPVAHARHVKVTNGGLTSDPVALLTWEDLRRRGLDARADRFAARVFSTPAQVWILRDLRARPFRGLSRPALQAAWDRAKQLIPAFQASRMDYVNFHWYHDDSGTLFGKRSNAADERAEIRQRNRASAQLQGRPTGE